MKFKRVSVFLFTAAFLIPCLNAAALVGSPTPTATPARPSPTPTPVKPTPTPTPRQTPAPTRTPTSTPSPTPTPCPNPCDNELYSDDFCDMAFCMLREAEAVAEYATCSGVPMSTGQVEQIARGYLQAGQCEL